jgi:recA bacterial DNA recombination protein
MALSAAIRLQVETKLANRVPAALTLKIKQAPELFPTGIREVDAVLGGGVPRGAITEIAGAASTGKTSFGLSTIATITQSGAACAWVAANTPHVDASWKRPSRVAVRRVCREVVVQSTRGRLPPSSNDSNEIEATMVRWVPFCERYVGSRYSRVWGVSPDIQNRLFRFQEELGRLPIKVGETD